MSSIMSSLARRSLSRLPRFARTKRHCCTPHCCCFHSISSSPISKITYSSLKPLSATPSLFHSSRSASSSTELSKSQADIKLSTVLQSEIECAKEEQQDGLDQLSTGAPINLKDPVSKGGLVPDGFPFEVVDNPGEDTITLKRDFEGEKIEVVVEMQHTGEEENAEDEDDDDKDEESDNNVSFNLNLVVTIVKGDGPRLEFICNANNNKIVIDAMLLKDAEEPSDENDVPYQGPEFMDLDENLQKEFYKYLEKRGIKNSMTTFLQEYMVDKESKEYVQWLNSMKEFVDK